MRINPKAAKTRGKCHTVYHAAYIAYVEISISKSIFKCFLLKHKCWKICLRFYKCVIYTATFLSTHFTLHQDKKFLE